MKLHKSPAKAAPGFNYFNQIRNFGFLTTICTKKNILFMQIDISIINLQ